MVGVSWAVICEKILQDPETGQPTLVNTIESVILNNESNPKKEPEWPVTLNFKRLFVIKFYRTDKSDDENVVFRLKATDKKGNSVTLVPSSRSSFRKTNFCVVIANFEQMIFQSEGMNWIYILIKTSTSWKTIFKVPLLVEFNRN